MITVRREVRSTRPVEVVARYLSDFTTTAQWDPHTERCTPLDGSGPEPALGMRYENVQKLLGRRTSFMYTLIELVPGRRIRLQGVSKNVEATDVMTFESAPPGLGPGTLVIYEASFVFTGALGRVEPVLRPLISKIADDGARGMSAALDRL